MCMPCCNKQIQLESNKPNIRNRYIQCVSQDSNKSFLSEIENILYISKDTNKLSQNRFGLLPLQLDIFFNNLTGRKMILKNIHFLEETIPSYFLKYGINQSSESFFESIGICINKTHKDIVDSIISELKKDSDERLFISLYNGQIKLLFQTIPNYIKYIQDFEQIDYKYLIDIICHIYNINILVFNRKFVFVNVDENNVTKIDELTLDCYNEYDITKFYETSRKNIILIKENNYFNPIFQITKANTSKNYLTNFWFYYNSQNIIHHVLDYYNSACINSTFLNNIQLNIITGLSLYKTITNNKQFKPTSQILDNNYKCIGIIINNKFVLSTTPSKIIIELPYLFSDHKNKNICSFKETYLFLIQFTKNINKNIDYTPAIIQYADSKSSIFLSSYYMILEKSVLPILRL